VSPIVIDARLVFYRRESGIGQYIVHLAQLAPAFDPGRRYVILQSRKDAIDLSTAANARRVDLWTPSHNRFEQLALPIELMRQRIALLHSPDFIPPFRGRYQRVITVHDLTFLHYPQFLTPESRRYYNDQIARAVQVADHILADSHATKFDLINLLGVRDDKISVVWLAPDTRYKPQPMEAIRPHLERLDLAMPYLLFVGTFEPRKNIAGLLQAYRALLERESAAPRLVIAGRRGWLFDETMARVDALQLRPRITFIDTPSDNELVALYHGALALVLPSYYEGFGLPVLEAMSCGAPVIISDRGSLPEIAGDAALAIDPDDPDALAGAMHRIIEDGALRQSLRNQGIRRAAEFTWERCARETLAVYRKVSGA
jgi:glycosyltransferase involved in cell wall biosynthesis